MRTVDLEALLTALRERPIMLEAHPLLRLFLPDAVEEFATTQALVERLDSPEPQRDTPLIAWEIDTRYGYRLPAFRCEYDPLTPDLNRVLRPHVGTVERHTLCQSRVAEEVLRRATGSCVVLVFCDGLSLWDWKRFAPSEWVQNTLPCFVDGVSSTTEGIHRLFDRGFFEPMARSGYVQGYGFSHWTRDNTLTDTVFRGLAGTVIRVSGYDEIPSRLAQCELNGACVGIVRQGTDQLGHSRWGEPDVAAEVRKIVRELETLCDVLRQRVDSWSLFMTSDHGLLWKQENSLTVLADPPSNNHPRYADRPVSGREWWIREERSALNYPYLTRAWHINEWGVHGGLSFEESFVPFVCRSTP